MNLNFSVPIRPRGKGRPRVTTRGGKPRTYTPKQTVEFENDIAKHARAAMSAARQEIAQGPLYMHVTALFPVPKSWSKRKRTEALDRLSWHTGTPDADNILKAVGDALNGVVWHDDKQLCFVKVTKHWATHACLNIMVTDL